MTNKKTILSDWTNREKASLSKALEDLHSKQPKTKPNHKVKTGVKGCHYSTIHGCYIINILKNGKRIYAGRLQEWNEAKAVALQAKQEQKWIEDQKIALQETA